MRSQRDAYINERRKATRITSASICVKKPAEAVMKKNQCVQTKVPGSAKHLGVFSDGYMGQNHYHKMSRLFHICSQSLQLKTADKTCDTAKIYCK